MHTDSDYYSRIEKLEKALNTDKNNPTELAELQNELNELMRQYRNDQSLGTDRYGLYQAQAMLSYHTGEIAKANRFIDYAVKIRGEEFKLAQQLKSHLINPDYQKKSEKKWWILIFAPIAALIAVALLQFIIHFIFSQTSSDGIATTSNLVTTVINIFSVLIGIVAVVLLMLIPIWLIRLNRARTNNNSNGYGKGLTKRSGVLIAIFLHFWYWVYTYEIDKKKFWINFGLYIVTVGYWAIIGWIWSIVDAVRRPKEFYELYPYYQS